MSKVSKKIVHPERRLRLLLFSLLIIAILISFYKKVFIFSLILIGASFLQYMTYRSGFKYNLGHVFFLAIITARGIGLLEGLLLVLLAGFIPKLMNNELDLKSLSHVPIEMVLVFVSVLFINYPITLIGVILAIINYTFSYLVAKLSGESIAEILTETALPFVMNLIYFLSMSGSFMTLLGKVIAI